MTEMKESQLPKVLAISISTWHKDSGIHTQTDLFKYWDPDCVAQIYTRSNTPNTPVCNRFFQISENAIIHSVINRKPVGKEVLNGESVNSSAFESEKKLYTIAHKKKSWFLTLIRELIWFLGKWKTKDLNRFLESFDADVYFIPIYPVIYMGRLQRYILKTHPKPYVCYLSDDNYTYLPCGKNIFAYIHRFFLRREVEYLAKNCDDMFTITSIEGEETDRLFGTNSKVLTKGIDYGLLKYEAKEINKPIRMVYTGNLLIGRASSLIEISKALKEINKHGEIAEFDIYSPTVVDHKTLELLNSNGCHYRGAVTKEKVFEIQKQADVVVFVESLEKKHRYDARLSFSTKLTDYFASGKCIFAIGDRNIAPIRYLRENDAAIIACEYSEIESQLSSLLNSRDLIIEYGRKAFDCGKRNHDSEIIKNRFIETLVHASKLKDKANNGK